jgi:four helix bundle protein
MATFQSFEELPIWQEARKLCLEIYSLTYASPFDKDYSLKDQIRRSAGSIMDNIAEGYERDGRLEFINFLSIAKGSAGEVRSQLHRAFDLKYISSVKYTALIEICRNLSGQIANFIKYLNNSIHKGTKFKNRVAASS